MIEKIKDILYDLSDIVVSLLIIAIIFVSVSWKISDTLDVNLRETLTNPSIEAENDPPVTVIIPNINPNENSDPTGENAENTDPTSDPTTNTPKPTQPDGDTTTPSDPATSPTTNSPTPPETSSPSSDALVAFEVPEGATGYSIGKKLVSEGYVDDVNTFVNRLVALKLDNKLHAGTFKLSKSDSLDVIIKVLAGQGR
ncbi:hypothetical protein [Fusibacter ferrireducens]|uniref:Endolytic transglycosylase MltG n=1 Tax=Fusibacter ferrireducens TaxID=2785058 RepID=A0ABR9ZYZ6_9FIRM|nr:hypothetical protein [Fusibacter ferrireducens]MBF4695672.1 hypothetical protein [Fusibacter ferrireducens]